ncbi:MAG: DUF2946 family protein [Armatimonadota bacterium]
MRINILYCLVTALWLVMQGVVPTYHHHEAGRLDSPAGTQWQAAHGDEHDCYICHIHYSPAQVASSESGLLPVLGSTPLVVPQQPIHPSAPPIIHPARAPPAA